MKSAQISSLTLFVAAAMAYVYPVNNPNADPSVPPAAQSKFSDDSTQNYVYSNHTTEPKVPDYIFVVMCNEQGFRGDCMVLGAPPGSCVSYYDFDPSPYHNVSDKFVGKIESLSTNTGGVCEFYHYEGCDINNDDGGVTLSYAYNLCTSQSGNTRPDDYSGDYCHNITSWRC